MRIIAIALLSTAAFVVMTPSSGSAAPASGSVLTEEATLAATPAAYARHRRTCHRKCFREFVVGRRVCKTYCDWW